MSNLRDSAKNFVPKTTKNIAELEVVSLDYPIQEREGVNNDGKTFEYKVVIVGEEEYRIPNSVLADIKSILSAKPNLKTVKVIKKGAGLATQYSVIPLD